MAEKTLISIVGRIIYNSELGKYDISEGKLELIAVGSGCYLTGYFTGHAYKDYSGFRIEATIVVYNGTGVFKGNGGDLQLLISGGLEFEKINQTKYFVQIIGILEKK